MPPPSRISRPVARWVRKLVSWIRAMPVSSPMRAATAPRTPPRSGPVASSASATGASSPTVPAVSAMVLTASAHGLHDVDHGRAQYDDEQGREHAEHHGDQH